MATFSPQDPTASIDRAAAMMVPEQGSAFKEQFGKSTADLAQHNVTATASTLAAGVEAIGPSAASVAVILRVTQNSPGQPADNAVLALRVTLTKRGGHWLVLDVSPINADDDSQRNRACSTIRQRSITTCIPAASASRPTCSCHATPAAAKGFSARCSRASVSARPTATRRNGGTRRPYRAATRQVGQTRIRWGAVDLGDRRVDRIAPGVRSRQIRVDLVARPGRLSDAPTTAMGGSRQMRRSVRSSGRPIIVAARRPRARLGAAADSAERAGAWP